MMMGDVRRCRRCKRKRLDDEPPEVRQYKTCAKCRIIERQKKKLRKPLAEETMLYGMKQFQQQHHNANFIHDDVFMDDNAFSGGGRSDTKRYEHEDSAPLQQQSQQHFYQYQPSQSFRSTPVAAMQTTQALPLAQQYQQQQHQQQHQQQQQQLQQRLRNQPVAVSMPDSTQAQATYCEVCSTPMDREDEVNMHYKLCMDCYTNPFKHNNVFADYNEYLLAISNNKQQDIDNFIFVKETDRNFSDSLLYLSKTINNERLYREFILENILMIYLDPIIASLGYKFNRISSNISDTNSLPPVFNPAINQYQYKNTKPIKSYHKFYKEGSLETNLYASFDVANNLLTIKLNQKILRPVIRYPKKFVDLVNSLVRTIVPSFSPESGYSYENGMRVYDELYRNRSSYEPEVQQLILALNKSNFSKDFGSSDSQFAGALSKTTISPESKDKPENAALDQQKPLSEFKRESTSEYNTPNLTKQSDTEEEELLQGEIAYENDRGGLLETPTVTPLETPSGTPAIQNDLVGYPTPSNGDNLDPAFGTQEDT